MSNEPMRVLFCFGVSQNFFDLPRDGITIKDVWASVIELLDSLKELPGLEYMGDIDDDSTVVGPSDGWPWTCYVLGEADSFDVVKAGCELLRTIPVGTDDEKLWKYLKVEARVGRALTQRPYQEDAEAEAHG